MVSKRSNLLVTAMRNPQLWLLRISTTSVMVSVVMMMLVVMIFVVMMLVVVSKVVI